VSAQKRRHSDSAPVTSKKSRANNGGDDFTFKDVTLWKTEALIAEMKDVFVLCTPVRKQDYIPDDPFIYKVLQAATKDRFKGMLMSGSLSTPYQDGSKVWSRIQWESTVMVDRVIALLKWDTRSAMPNKLQDKIRQLY
jgi:hypothetical protein